MRRSIILMMVALVTVTTAWSYQPSVYEIDELKDQMVKLNRLRHPNPDKVMPGDEVLVPADNPDTPGIESDVYLVYAVLPGDMVYGRANCFWRIAERHLQNNQAITPMTTSLWSPAPPPDSMKSDQTQVLSVTETKNKLSSEQLWLLVLVFAIAGVLFWWLLRNSLNKSIRQADLQREIQAAQEENPANYPPVMPGGMVDDPQAAAQQVQQFYGFRPIRMERGFFRRAATAPEYVLHRMAFGGSVQQVGRIYAENGQRRGDRLYRGVTPGNGLRYFVMSCGNMGTELLDVPQGWEWVAEATAETALPIQEITHQETVTAPENPETDETKSVTVTIESEGDQPKLTLTCEGNAKAMWTSFKRNADGSVEILFPKAKN